MKEEKPGHFYKNTNKKNDRTSYQKKLRTMSSSRPSPDTATADEPVRQAKANNTGLPGNLKTGLENLSGIDLSDVRVHTNSAKPEEVGALAYTQGTEIYVAPGQEKHLPHEAAHVVQQLEGRVKPTGRVAGLPLNDSPQLEREADEMGRRALQTKPKENKSSAVANSVAQKKSRGKQGFGFVDNRAEAIGQRKLKASIRLTPIQSKNPPIFFSKSEAIQLMGISAIPQKDRYFKKDFADNSVIKNELEGYRELFQNAIRTVSERCPGLLIKGVPIETEALNVLRRIICVYNLMYNSTGKHGQNKKNAIFNGLTELRSINEGPILQRLQTASGSMITGESLMASTASRKRIIGLLEEKKNTEDVTIFKNVIQTNNNLWKFQNHNESANGEIHILYQDAGGIHAQAEADNTVIVTIHRTYISKENGQSVERQIADKIAAAYRTHSFRDQAVLEPGSAHTVLSKNDQDKIAILRHLYKEYRAAEENLLARLDAPDRQIKAQELKRLIRKEIVDLDLQAQNKRQLVLGVLNQPNEAGLRDYIESEGIYQEFKPYTQARGGTNPDNENVPQIITPQLIEHMIQAERRGFGEHKLMGIKGGHDEARLLAFVQANSLYHIKQISEKNVTINLGQGSEILLVRRYLQYRWNENQYGDPPAVEDAAHRPDGADFDANKWSVSDVPKTTVNNLQMFLHLGASAFKQWHGQHSSNNQEEEFNGPDASSQQGNVGYQGYIRTDPVGGLKKLETLFVSSDYLDQ
ncbi:MAG: DUF4157 domain-containing protein [bacterium]|nr:DUF4157 domain-containing protein [bacterium]